MKTDNTRPVVIVYYTHIEILKLQNFIATLMIQLWYNIVMQYTQHKRLHNIPYGHYTEESSLKKLSVSYKDPPLLTIPCIVQM